MGESEILQDFEHRKHIEALENIIEELELERDAAQRGSTEYRHRIEQLKKTLEKIADMTQWPFTRPDWQLTADIRQLVEDALNDSRTK